MSIQLLPHTLNVDKKKTMLSVTNTYIAVAVVELQKKFRRYPKVL